MGRKSSLKTKQVGAYVYWRTQSHGGKTFGRVGEVPADEAQRRFDAWLILHGETPETGASVEMASESVKVSEPVPSQAKPVATNIGEAGAMSVSELAFNFLEFVKSDRSHKNYSERKLHLSRFENFEGNGFLPALSMTHLHLTRFLEAVKKQGKRGSEIVEMDAFTNDKHARSVIACFNWAISPKNKKDGKSILPETFKPFGAYAPLKLEIRSMQEERIFDKKELKTIQAGIITEEKKGNTIFATALRIYMATGARVSEITEAKAGDYQIKAKCFIRTEWKNARKTKQNRIIQIPAPLVPKVEALIDGLHPDSLILRGVKDNIHHHWRDFCETYKIRQDTTLGSFRHTWISTALLNGMSSFEVARAVGNSPEMIDKVYGHLTKAKFKSNADKVAKALGIK